MSIALMTAAFKTALPPTIKFVFVALCDNANDQGECYPSVQMLCQKTSFSERAVRASLAKLKKLGFINFDNRVGKSNYFYIFPVDKWEDETVNPCTSCTPAPRAPLHDVHPRPAPDAPPPLHDVHPRPAPRAPITIIEPSIEPSVNHQIEKPSKKTFLLPDWIPKDLWDDFERMRKDIKKPMTDRASGMIISKLSDFQQRGFCPKASLSQSIVNCWADVYEPKQPRAQQAKQTLYEQNMAAAERAKRMIFGEEAA